MAATRQPAPVQLVRAVATFHGPDRLTVTDGDIYAADAAVVAAYPAFFAPVEAKTEP